MRTRPPYCEPDTAGGYRFRWKCSYLRYTWYDVTPPNGPAFEVEFRAGLMDYEASIYNGGAEAYRRECGPLVRVLRASCPSQETPPALVEAFNAWRLACHNYSLGFMRADPDRYGAAETWAPEVLDPPPLAVDGAHYRAGRWIFNSQPADLAEVA